MLVVDECQLKMELYFSQFDRMGFSMRLKSSKIVEAIADRGIDRTMNDWNDRQKDYFLSFLLLAYSSGVKVMQFVLKFILLICCTSRRILLLLLLLLILLVLLTSTTSSTSYTNPTSSAYTTTTSTATSTFTTTSTSTSTSATSTTFTSTSSTSNTTSTATFTLL